MVIAIQCSVSTDFKKGKFRLKRFNDTVDYVNYDKVDYSDAEALWSGSSDAKLFIKEFLFDISLPVNGKAHFTALGGVETVQGDKYSDSKHFFLHRTADTIYTSNLNFYYLERTELVDLLNKQGIKNLENVDEESMKIRDPVLFQRLEKIYGVHYLKSLQSGKIQRQKEVLREQQKQRKIDSIRQMKKKQKELLRKKKVQE